MTLCGRKTHNTAPLVHAPFTIMSNYFWWFDIKSCSNIMMFVVAKS